jgi:hypothetical protein
MVVIAIPLETPIHLIADAHGPIQNEKMGFPRLSDILR